MLLLNPKPFAELNHFTVPTAIVISFNKLIASILPAILPTVGKLVDKIFPDEEANKREKLKIEQELLKQLQSVDLAQIEVNKVEAAEFLTYKRGR